LDLILEKEYEIIRKQCRSRSRSLEKKKEKKEKKEGKEERKEGKEKKEGKKGNLLFI